MELDDKDPSAVKDYGVDWSLYLQPGETIAESTWILPEEEGDSPLTAGDGSNGAPAPSSTSAATVVWLMGGEDQTSYAVVNRITTSQGRTDERTLHVNVRHT